MRQYEGDWAQGDRSHVRVRRLVLSEKDRVGIGTFQPKDEKNQDSTELTGDINYRKIAEYGSDSRSARVQLRRRVQHRQPRHHRVRRGAEARRRVPLRPARRVAGAQDQAEEVRADRHRRGHPRPHQRGRVQEAPEQRVHGGAARPHDQDRHPVHHASVTEEIRIYEKDFNAGKIRGKHIAPHTLEVAAMWAVLTRLEDPKKHNLSLLQKMKLYDGKMLPGFTQDNVKELRKEAKREGMDGISPALHPGQDLERARQRHGRGHDQPVHGDERAREGPAPPLAHHQRRAAQALPRDARRS